ncbi:MAG: hypothetical protein JRD68_14620, partial [Deltaproteobacteria bacterium]|nr:hypothetical protein [Deltaproteobacteria bacterium]
MLFTEDEHDKHLEIASQIHQSFPPHMREIVNNPITPDDPSHKKKRIQPEDHLFFDMHTRRKRASNPHIVVWFKSKDGRQYIEIAI